MPLLSKTLWFSLLASALVLGAACQPAATSDPRSPGDSAQQSRKEEPQAVESKAADPASDSTVNQANHQPVGAEAAPVDLTRYYSLKASAFDGSTRYPWPAVPRGPHTFANVPVEIGGAIFLWGERNAKAGLKYPEEVKGIPIQRRFETLYVCHAAFYEGKAGTPMYEARFQYDDGTSASDVILCGDDARDWFANRAEEELGPSAPRSMLAWDGDAKVGDRIQAICFCLTAISNPHPEKVVMAIDFVSSKTQTASCILAVTTGKAGLMQKTKATQASDE
ncbi:MAG: hypothetical protein HY000_40410 [Planctomycetes bacterium]|nr:hypothetical protein [Planctomycetota bacterium]